MDLRDHYVGQPFNYIDFSKMLYGEGGEASTGTRDRDVLLRLICRASI